MTYDQAQEERIYRWRSANKDSYLAIQREASKKYYAKKKAKNEKEQSSSVESVISPQVS